MIDFSTLKELYVDGKKVTSLFLDGHEVPMSQPSGPQYFTVTALEQDTTVSIVKTGTPPAFSLEYSTDGDMWSSYSAEQTVTLAASKSMMFRRVGDATTTFSSDTSNYWHFTFSANVKVSGNIMSLLDASMESTTVGTYAFYRLFTDQTTLVDASELELPATTLAVACYINMFYLCTSLSSAPALPATTLADNCYNGMFYNCSSLTSAPALPATTLADRCYNGMFQYCSSLTSAPALPATTLANYCYNGMFRGCSSLTSAPALPATTLAEYCYSSMFRDCTSLSAAPALPATTLANQCYSNMFNNCSSLTAAPALPATTLADNCYNGMFRGCTSIASAPALPATTLRIDCYNSMFRDCTSLSAAPELPATTLASDCYANMFMNCRSLMSAPELPATTLASDCYTAMFYFCRSLTAMDVKFTAWSPSSATNNWLYAVAATGTFKCPEALGTDATIQRGNSYCPTGWTVVNYDA